MSTERLRRNVTNASYSSTPRLRPRPRHSVATPGTELVGRFVATIGRISLDRERSLQALSRLRPGFGATWDPEEERRQARKSAEQRLRRRISERKSQNASTNGTANGFFAAISRPRVLPTPSPRRVSEFLPKPADTSPTMRKSEGDAKMKRKTVYAESIAVRGATEDRRQATRSPQRAVRKFCLADLLKQVEEEKEGTTRYKAEILTDQRLQGFIFSDELSLLLERASQLKFVLQRGIKLKTSDVIGSLTSYALRVFDTKLADISGYLYYVVAILKETFSVSPAGYDCEKAQDALLRTFAAVQSQSFPFCVQLLCSAFDLFRCVAQEYLTLRKRREFQPARYRLAQTLLGITDKARYLVDSVEIEYRVLEQAEEKRRLGGVPHRVPSLGPMAAGSGTAVFDRLARGDPSKPVTNLVKKAGKSQPREIEPEAEETVEEKTNLFINKCLHKIMPLRETLIPASVGSPRRSVQQLQQRKELEIFRKRKNADLLIRSIRILKQTATRDNSEMAVRIGGLIHQLESDYGKTKLQSPHH